jgi:hypothetical protein
MLMAVISFALYIVCWRLARSISLDRTEFSFSQRMSGLIKLANSPSRSKPSMLALSFILGDGIQTLMAGSRKHCVAADLIAYKAGLINAYHAPRTRNTEASANIKSENSFFVK